MASTTSGRKAETILRAWKTPSGTRAMSFTLAGEIIFSGLAERRILPVATALNRMPSLAATRASRLSAVPTHRTSSARPLAMSLPCSVRTAVSAG